MVLYYVCSYTSDINLDRAQFNGMKYMTTISFKILLLSGFWVVLVVLLFLYGSIFKVAKRHAHQIQAADALSLALHGDIDTISSLSKTRKILRTDIRLAKRSALIFGLFYLSYIPAIISLSLILFAPDIGKRTEVSVILLVSNRIINVNSVINPFTYAFKSWHFRQAFLAFVRCRKLALD